MTEEGAQRQRQTPIQCWGCKGNHKYRDCPYKNGKARTVHTIQQDETVEDMGNRILRIYAALDKKQEEFQSHMIEVEGMINNRPLIILIDSRASHSYVDPRVVESLLLSRRKHENSWLVQLATRTKRKVTELVKSYSVDMGDIDELAVRIEFHQGSKPVECVRGYTRLGMDSGLQLGVISVEDGHFIATACSCRWSTTAY
jgi:hypothetical protein